MCAGTSMRREPRSSWSSRSSRARARCSKCAGTGSREGSVEKWRRPGAPRSSTRFLLEELEQIARRHLVEEGYLRPWSRSTWRWTRRATRNGSPWTSCPDHARWGRVIRFTGNEQLSDGQLDLLITPGRDADAWAGGDTLPEAVVATYQAQGLLEATASLREAVFEAIRRCWRSRSARSGIRLSEVSVEGATAWSADQVAAAAGVGPGAVYTAGLAEAARADVLVAYRGAGFNAVRVRVEPTIGPADGEVALLIAVDEGRRQLLRTIEVIGALRTHADMIDRALRLEPGEPVDQAVLEPGPQAAV